MDHNFLTGLRERMAVAEKLLENAKDRLDLVESKMENAATSITEISTKYSSLESKIDHISEEFKILSDSFGDLINEIKESKLIDKVELQLYEKQRRKVITILGIVGTFFITTISNYDQAIKLLKVLFQ